MRATLAVVMVLTCCEFGFSAEPTLEERLTQLEKRQKATEAKLEGVDSKLDAILAAVVAKKAGAMAPTTTLAVQQPIAPRAFVGHTHTCANGHTWDHSMTPSHNCPQCGLYQSVQDTPRAAYSAPQPLQYSLSTAGSSCANSRCEVPQRRGLFGLRR